MNKKIVGIAGAVVLGAIGTLGLAAYVNGAADRARAGEDLVDVFVVTEPVKAGTPAADLASKVKVEQVPTKVRPREAVQDFKSLEGLVASVDLVPGEELLASRFVNPATSQVTRSALTAIPAGLHEVTLQLEPERALGGDLRPGDTVGVVASFDSQQADEAGVVAAANLVARPSTPDTSHLVLHKVLVTRLQSPPSASGGNKNGATQPPGGKMFVTLAVDPTTLERLVYCAEFGRVWLSYEPRDATTEGTKIVTRTNVYGSN
jgi:pilus assembly protein CpaB